MLTTKECASNACSTKLIYIQHHSLSKRSPFREIPIVINTPHCPSRTELLPGHPWPLCHRSGDSFIRFFEAMLLTAFPRTGSRSSPPRCAGPPSCKHSSLSITGQNISPAHPGPLCRRSGDSMIRFRPRNRCFMAFSHFPRTAQWVRSSPSPMRRLPRRVNTSLYPSLDRTPPRPSRPLCRCCNASFIRRKRRFLAFPELAP